MSPKATEQNDRKSRARSKPQADQSRGELIPARKSSKKVTRGNSEAIRQKVYFEHVEPLSHEMFDMLRLKVRQGDNAALKLAAEITQFAAGKAPAIVANFNNKNSAVMAAAVVESPSSPPSSIDSIIRRMDQRDMRASSAQDFIDV